MQVPGLLSSFMIGKQMNEVISHAGLLAILNQPVDQRQANGEIKLANLTQRVRDLLQITKLMTVFDCYDNVDNATAAFQKRATA